MRKPQNDFELKALMLCEGINADKEATKRINCQNPLKVKRGGLSSGAKISFGKMTANVPLYSSRACRVKLYRGDVLSGPDTFYLSVDGEVFSQAWIFDPPEWYHEFFDGIIWLPRIFTAHNRQIAAAIYEKCKLFCSGDECKFCVMKHSINSEGLPRQSASRLVIKTPKMIIKALDKIPLDTYDGITFNGGMTLDPGRGLELILPVAYAIRQNPKYDGKPIAVEITPPSDLNLIDKLAQYGNISLMMNLECWSSKSRKNLIPGKNRWCPRNQYLNAFKKAVDCLGRGRVSTCFVLGTESDQTLKKGIREVINLGVIPSLLCGRFFEDIKGYSFTPQVNWENFLELIIFARNEMNKAGLTSTDQAGCIACGMCDLIKDVI